MRAAVYNFCMAIFSLIMALLLERGLHEDVTRWRSFDWLQQLHELLQATLSDHAAIRPGDLRTQLPLLLTLGLPLLLLTLLLGMISWLLGSWIMVPASLLLLLYCLGPEDLLTLYRKLHSDDQTARRQALQQLRDLNWSSTASGHGNVQQSMVCDMLLTALRGWFVIIFWFTVMGIVAGMPAALLLTLLYRLAERCLALDLLLSTDEHDQQHWLQQLCWLLEWPVARLMVGLMALVGDFDLVHDVWHEQSASPEEHLLQHSLLLAVAQRQLDQNMRHSTSAMHADGLAAMARAGNSLLQRMLMLLTGLLVLLVLLAWIL